MPRVTPARLLVACLCLLVLSRLPALLHTPDFGVFWVEHLWEVEDPAAVKVWERVFDRAGSVIDIDPGLYTVHYHGGSLAVTAAVLALSRLTGSDGLLQLELVGLLASLLALVAYFTALVQTWPGERARWGFAVFVAFLAPPTLFFWITIIPLGHFTDTWFFHALSMPVFVALCRGRGSPLTLGLLGIVAGVATWYVFSNAVFVALFAACVLCWGAGGWRGKLVRLVALSATWAVTWLQLSWPRMDEVVHRVRTVAVPSSEAAGNRAGWIRVFDNVPGNLDEFLTLDALIEGGSWCLRGLFALVEPAGSPFGIIAGAVIGLTIAAGALYMTWHTLLLLRPRRWLQMTLPQRVYAVQGLFLLPTVLGFFVFRNPGDSMQLLMYLTPGYCVWLFGASQSLWDGVTHANPWARRTASGAVLFVGVLLAIGWVESTTWVARPLDRPDLGVTSFRQVRRSASMGVGNEFGPSGVRQVRDYCTKAHPGSDSFCVELAWAESAHPPEPHSAPGTGDPDLLARCLRAPPEERVACATAVGSRFAGSAACDTGSHEGPLADRCTDFPPELRQACLTGVHRGPLAPYRVGIPCSQKLLMAMCGGEDPNTPRDWRFRTCLEALGPMLTGAPPWPEPSASAATGPCAGWPHDWRGLCEDLAAARIAGPDERSCEDIYLERFAERVPTTNKLVYEQCIYIGSQPNGWEFYPSCVIGVAKAMEGLECSWSGAPLRLL